MRALSLKLHQRHTAVGVDAVAERVEQIRKALLGYRVLAWVTGVWLIALCYEMVMKYGFNDDSLSWIAVVHGWVYFIYLLFAANLAVKVRWPIGAILSDAVGPLHDGTWYGTRFDFKIISPANAALAYNAAAFSPAQ